MKENLPKEGIYFNMPAEEYFALPFFSRSLAQKVRFSGEEAEFYIKNPTKETRSMELGTALHSMFLEPEKFDKTYIKNPSITDEIYQGKKIIQTVEDLKPFLEMYGLKKTGKKEDLIESVRSYLDPSHVIIWDDVKVNFDRQVILDNKKVLSNEDFQILFDLNNKFNENENLHDVLKNGRAEVVVIWKDRETGIICKCRLDYVQPNSITDLKSYSVKDFNTPLLDQLRKKTVFSYYNFQYAIYAEALETVIDLINEGKAEIYGEDDENWKLEFLKNSKKKFSILFVRTSAPYQMQILELKNAEVLDATNNAYFTIAQNIWRNSIRKFAHFLKTGKWLGENSIEVLLDVHVPNVSYQQVFEDNLS